MKTPYVGFWMRIFIAAASFVFVSLFLSPQAIAQDTTDVVFDDPYKYPLSDPRNPNCPCHKRQQLADEEFKKLVRRGRGSRQPVSTFEAKSNPKPIVANAQIAQQVSARFGAQDGTKSTRGNGLRIVISNADHWLYKKSERFKHNLVGRKRVGNKSKKCFLF